MPAFFDHGQLQHAIAARAVPALEQLADHPNDLEHLLDNRFDRDEPPPYMSSSESEEEEALRHPIMVRPEEAVLEEFSDLIGKSLTDDERNDLLMKMDSVEVYAPGHRFLQEARHEHGRLSQFYGSEKANERSRDILTRRGSKGDQRRDIIVRRNIRKRWERLGVWNNAWGIPGRVHKQPNDNTDAWRWKWQPSADPSFDDPRHPNTRAVQLRTNLSYGEHVLPPPRSHLQDDASVFEAESFIISRPWFTYSLEQLEFRVRKRRIPWDQRGRVDDKPGNPVLDRWKKTDDWKEEWVVPGFPDRAVPGWKWRHESPSPEPEDLTPLNTGDMDFTPSEIDALEAIPPNSPPRPCGWSSIPQDDDSPEPKGPPRPTGGFGVPGAPGWVPLEGWGASHPHDDAQLSEYAAPDGLADGEDDSEPADREYGDEPADREDEDEPMPDAQPNAPPDPPAQPEFPVPPPRRRGRPRKQPQPAGAAGPPPPPPARRPQTIRRSARIAAMQTNRPPQPAPPPATILKPRTRTPRGPPAAPPVSASRSTAEIPKKKRGRPRKTQDGGISKPAAPAAAKKKRGRKPSARTAALAEAAAAAMAGEEPKKRGRKPAARTAAAAEAAAAAVSGEEGKKSSGSAASPVVKRGRGRPRKTG